MIHVYGKRVVEIDGVSPGLITMDGATIVGLERNPTELPVGTQLVSDGCLVFPGFIDIHTHCREDVSGEDTYKEDYTTVGRAALSGGVVCIADMPNNPIVPSNCFRYMEKLRLTERCPVDVLPYAGIGPSTSQFDDAVTGLRTDIKFARFPYKVFMGPSTRSEDLLYFTNAGQLSSTLARYRDCQVSFHCEDPVLLHANRSQLTHELRRPSVCEESAIDTACELIECHGLRGKICHVSTKLGLTTLLGARESGVAVKCEVTPHHLYFDVEMLTSENRPFLQMNPPLRSRAEREFLLEQVRRDKIDFLASDHAPHTTTDKLRGISGVPELDTYGPFVGWLIQVAKVKPVTIFNMACKAPGEWISIFQPERKLGRLATGYEASVTVLDLAKVAVDGRPLYTKCGWSPFDLRTLPGLVQTVYYKGEKVVDGVYMKDFKSV